MPCLASPRLASPRLARRGGDPGAKVVSDGGPPTTREGRLLSWAGEIEAQMSSQRAELRRTRMELVAAQEVRRARCAALCWRALVGRWFWEWVQGR